MDVIPGKGIQEYIDQLNARRITKTRIVAPRIHPQVSLLKGQFAERRRDYWRISRHWCYFFCVLGAVFILLGSWLEKL